MRIISGKFRRRKLLAKSGLVTRPITDRVKEVLFERLRNDLELRRVADVFAGTGTIGLEALSRGAASIVFIERDRKALELLKRNVEMLGAEGDTLCWHTDVLTSSFRPKGVGDFFPYDLVFFDPPYRMISDLVPGSRVFKALERMARDRVTSAGARLILRTQENAVFDFPKQWEHEQTLAISSMEIHFYVRTAAA